MTDIRKSEALRDALRAVIDEPRFNECTVAEILGVLRILEHEMIERLKETP